MLRRRCKALEKKGYPRFKMRVRSLTWCLRKHKLKTGERVRQNPIIETNLGRLKVPKLGEVKIYMHRPLVGDPKEVTLVKKASGWYAHISCEIPDTPKVEPMLLQLTLALLYYLTTSEGGKEDNPRWYRKAEGLLHKHNQTMARRKKGSNRWQKSVHCRRLTLSGQQTNVRTLSGDSSLFRKTMSYREFTRIQYGKEQTPQQKHFRCVLGHLL